MTAALAERPRVADVIDVGSLAPCELRRTLDASLFNRVANDPAVRPWLGGDRAIDLTSDLANLANYGLVTDGGGFFLQCLAPTIYEVHSMFLAGQRRNTVAAMRAGMEYMFTRTDCRQLVTKVPDDNKPAAALARVGGFKEMFRRDGVWNGGGVSYQALSLDDWAMGCRELEADGEWFHSRLEALKREAGSDLPTHDHDPAHERAVGAAVRMMRADNAAKGVDFYNRWAVFAGYAPIALITETPTVLDLGDAVVELRNGDMEALKCR